MTVFRGKVPGKSHSHKQDKACDLLRALGPVEQRTANGPAHVLITEDKTILRDIFLEQLEIAKVKHARGREGRDIASRRFAAKHGASSIFINS